MNIYIIFISDTTVLVLNHMWYQQIGNCGVQSTKAVTNARAHLDRIIWCPSMHRGRRTAKSETWTDYSYVAFAYSWTRTTVEDKTKIYRTLHPCFGLYLLSHERLIHIQHASDEHLLRSPFLCSVRPTPRRICRVVLLSTRKTACKTRGEKQNACRDYPQVPCWAVLYCTAQWHVILLIAHVTRMTDGHNARLQASLFQERTSTNIR